MQEVAIAGFFITAWWFISFGALGLFATLFFARNEFFEKPKRLNVRDTPLYKPSTTADRLKLSRSAEYEMEDLP